MNSKKHTLLLDCGNTYLKWCVFDGEDLTVQQSLYHKDASVLETLKKLIENQATNCDSIVMVSVLGEVFLAGTRRIAQDSGLSLLEVHSQEKLVNLRNGYKQPEQLGSDRLVAMVGAYDLIDDLQACIVIDSGTATTIDAIDETGQHLGGVIFPGIELSVNSLSDNTEQLPNLDDNKWLLVPNGLATDTSQAITTGCLLSLAGGIDGICNKMQRQLEATSFQPSIKVKRILCGGGAKALLPYLENDYEHHENLIMLGLNKIHISHMETMLTND